MKTLLFLLALCSCASSQARTVTLNWTASTSPNVSYNIYRANGSCPATSAVKIGSVAVGVVTYVDSTVTVGTYCYYVTAAGGGLESVPSNNAIAVVVPVAPTGLTVTPSLASVRVRGTVQFAANRPSSWSLSPNIGTVTSDGLYNAPFSIKNTTTVTVTARALDTGELATALVTVRKR